MEYLYLVSLNASTAMSGGIFKNLMLICMLEKCKLLCINQPYKTQINKTEKDKISVSWKLHFIVEWAAQEGGELTVSGGI